MPYNLAEELAGPWTLEQDLGLWEAGGSVEIERSPGAAREYYQIMVESRAIP